MHVHDCVLACGRLGLMLGLVLNHSFTLSKVGDVSPLTPELTDTASFSSQLLWGSLTLSHKARITGKPPHPPAFMWVLGVQILLPTLHNKHSF